MQYARFNNKRSKASGVFTMSALIVIAALWAATTLLMVTMFVGARYSLRLYVLLFGERPRATVVELRPKPATSQEPLARAA